MSDANGNYKWLRRAHLEYAIAIVISLTVIFLLQNKFSRSDSDLLSPSSISGETLNPQSDSLTDSGVRDTVSPNALAKLKEERESQRLEATTIVSQLPFALADEYHQHLLDGKTEWVNHELLQKASEAVASGDNQTLGETIALLGSVAMLEHNTEAASLYLDEATEIFGQRDDELGAAGVELLRGQLNIEKRWQARKAASAYDAMQIAGWKIAHGRFSEVVPEMEQLIESNIELNRYGAAAAGYETLYRGYNRSGQSEQAIQAGIEAAKFHVSSGRHLKANALLEKLDTLGFDPARKQAVRTELHALQLEYESSVKQIGNANNYEQLYHHYINKGDPVRAWQFRVKSSQSLRGVSKRAMNRRQTGVIALLYNSNEDMEQAADALQRAERVFVEHDAGHLMDVSGSMRAKIY